MNTRIDPNIIIGIDPGRKGGIALLNKEISAPLVAPLPYSGKELDSGRLSDWIRLRIGDGDKVVAFVEKSQAMVRPDKAGKASKAGKKSGRVGVQGNVSSFNYGVGYGQIRGVLGALHIETHLVPHWRWRRIIIPRTRKGKTKPAAIAFCQRRWPELNLIQPRCRNPHDGIADALCIAAFGEVVCRG